MRHVTSVLLVAMLAPGVASASTVQDYRMDVTGTLRDFRFNALVVTEAGKFDPLTVYDEAEVREAFLDSKPFFRALVDSGSGSAMVRTNGEAYGSRFTSCSGILTPFCLYSHVRWPTFDPVLGTAFHSDNTSFVAQVGPLSFHYIDDQGISGSSANYDYRNTGDGITIAFDLSALSVTAVPVPAGGLLLLTAVAALGTAARRRSGRASAGPRARPRGPRHPAVTSPPQSQW